MDPSVASRFSFGRWNISEGADPFGPGVRPAFPHGPNFARYRPLRSAGVQFHDDQVLPGHDPGTEISFALAHDKRGSVHLNDQNGHHDGQDKNFDAANLRVAFNQVRVIEDAGCGRCGEVIGLAMKAMRTRAGPPVTAQLANSREFFLLLVEKYRSMNASLVSRFHEARDYEALERHTMRHLPGT